jgi:streptogramin lyase
MKKGQRFDFDLRDHGIPVRRGSVMSVVSAPHPKTGRDRVFLGYNTGGNFLVVQVDPATGRCVPFDGPPGCQGPWGMIAVPDGRLIVTSVAGQVCVLDPAKKTFKVVAQAKTWFWSITRGCDGLYYLASSPGAHLWRFNLETAQLDDLGSMSDTQVYLRVVIGAPDGYVYGSTGSTAPQIIAYHIATGKVTELLPAREEKHLPFPSLGWWPDGGIVALSNGGNAYRLEGGKAKPIGKANWSSYEPQRLTDGRPVRYVDPDSLRVGEGRKARVLPVAYKAPGTGIFHLAEGPGKTVYGSTIMPLYLFRHTPKTGKTECLGRGGPDNGEAYSFGHADGILYYATYSTGLLMRYDPEKPWEPSPKWNKNPRLLGPLGTGHNRPRAMFVDAKKRVWVGSIPEYGKTTGGLACYDTVKKRLDNNPVVVPDQSIMALTADDEARVIYGATDIEGGSGAGSRTKEAKLFAWDPVRKRRLWDVVPIPGATGIINLLYVRGKLYGNSRAPGMVFNFFCFDPATRKVVYVIPSDISAVREQSMSLGPDGNIYGITWITLFRWRPEAGTIDVLVRTPEKEAARYSGGSLFHRGAAIIGGRLYFSCGAQVRSMRLPLGEP